MSKIAPATTVRSAAKSGTSKFAHLTSMPPLKAEDPKDKKDDDKDAKRARQEGESDDDYAARMAKMDEDEKKEAANPKDGDKEADGDEKEKEAAATTRGVLAERERWSAVMAAPETAGRLATACTLLADTELSATQVIGVLKTTPEAKVEGSLARRMAAAAATIPAPDAGGKEVKATDPKGIAALIVATSDKVRGEPKKAA